MVEAVVKLILNLYPLCDKLCNDENTGKWSNLKPKIFGIFIYKIIIYGKRFKKKFKANLMFNFLTN